MGKPFILGTGILGEDYLWTTDNGTMIVTRGRLGSGVYPATKGLFWRGLSPTATAPAYAGTMTLTDRAGRATVTL